MDQKTLVLPLTASLALEEGTASSRFDKLNSIIGRIFDPGYVYEGYPGPKWRDSLVALDISSGSLLWTVGIDGPFDTKARPLPVQSSVIVRNLSGAIYSIDTVTGSLQWANVTDSLSLHRYLMRVLQRDGAKPIRQLHRGRRRNTGDSSAQALSYEMSRLEDLPELVEDTTPLCSGDCLILGGTDGSLVSLSAMTGKPRWSAGSAALITAAPIVVGDRVVAGLHDGSVFAATMDDGGDVSELKVGRGQVLCVQAREAGVVVGLTDGDVAWVDVQGQEAPCRPAPAKRR